MPRSANLRKMRCFALFLRILRKTKQRRAIWNRAKTAQNEQILYFARKTAQNFCTDFAHLVQNSANFLHVFACYVQNSAKFLRRFWELILWEPLGRDHFFEKSVPIKSGSIKWAEQDEQILDSTLQQARYRTLFVQFLDIFRKHSKLFRSETSGRRERSSE